MLCSCITCGCYNDAESYKTQQVSGYFLLNINFYPGSLLLPPSFKSTKFLLSSSGSLFLYTLPSFISIHVLAILPPPDCFLISYTFLFLFLVFLLLRPDPSISVQTHIIRSSRFQCTHKHIWSSYGVLYFTPYQMVILWTTAICSYCRIKCQVQLPLISCLQC